MFDNVPTHPFHYNSPETNLVCKSTRPWNKGQIYEFTMVRERKNQKIGTSEITFYHTGPLTVLKLLLKQHIQEYQYHQKQRRTTTNTRTKHIYKTDTITNHNSKSILIVPIIRQCSKILSP